ncbi:MAG: ribosome biogenesis GTPase Der [Deltaproteobacteria bacterium]|nr:ribosome biogenesis GTPase Der [Deltaproteobacteria bacterium]
MKPLVAIVGRPNVGKSALFNRILGGRRRAITKDEPGVTRDLNYADCSEGGRSFTLVDTGGFEPAAKEAILRKVKEQATLAVEEADVIIFLMDNRQGVMPGDRELVAMLRRTGKKVIYAANKVDTKRLIPAVSDFYSLGIDDVLAVSAESGLGVDELLDAVIANLPREEPSRTAGWPAVSAVGPSRTEATEAGQTANQPSLTERVRVAIVGRPNAGKSSLLNKLIGKQRAIVSDVPGTTRDSIDTPFEKDGKGYLFIDTAGIRKKGRITRTLEAYCVFAAIKTIERSDVALLVIDGMEGLKMQDEKIAGFIERRGKGCVIVVNKWDTVVKDVDSTRLYTERIRLTMPFLQYAPVVFTSALTGRGIRDLFGRIDEVFEQSTRRFTTSRLNRLLEGFVAQTRPSAYRGKEVKLYYMTQTGTAPVKFAVFANLPKGVTESYRRYLVNRFRESLGLTDAPVRVVFRSRR